MTCIHLQQLYELCREHDLKLGGSDLIRVVCHQCDRQEVCPSNLMEQLDDVEPSPAAASPTPSGAGQ
jgi:hypothetical protein